MQRVARSGTAVFDARFREEGVLTDADPVLVDVSDPNDVQVVANASPTTHPSTGRYTYSSTVASDAPLGIWRIDWEGTINGASVSGGEVFEVIAVPAVDFPTDTFATVDELATWMGTTFPAGPEEDLAVLVLEGATAAIRNLAGDAITGVVDDEVVLDGNDADVIFLPSFSVSAVTAVTVGVEPGNAGTTLNVAEDVIWYRDGRLYRRSGSCWGSKRQSVSVMFSHGYEQVPADIRDVCLARAKRVINGEDGVRREEIGSYAIEFTDPAGGTFIDDEKKIIGAYRLPVMG